MIDWFTGLRGGLDDEHVLLADVVQDAGRRCSRSRTGRPRPGPARCRGSGRSSGPAPGWRCRGRSRTGPRTRPPPVRRTRRVTRRSPPSGPPRPVASGSSLSPMPARSASPGRNAAIADDPVALGQAHDDHAARARRVAVDRVRLGPDDLAAGRDQDELLVALGDLLDGRDDAGLACPRARSAGRPGRRGACGGTRSSATRLP